jgi:predicted  nucleic acid-binding Zn-ribbon protein
MKSENQAPADLLNLLRQQITLAQVRIMDLEDQADELAPRLSETEQLLTAAQTLATRQTEEAVHLEKVRADLQTQYDHLRHVQHVTNEALNAARAEAASQLARANQLVTETKALRQLTGELAAAERATGLQLAQLNTELAALRDETVARLARIQELDAEQRAIKASRSWRWTAWLRSLERAMR